MQLKQGLRIADLPALVFALTSLCGTLFALFVPLEETAALLLSLGLIASAVVVLLVVNSRLIGVTLAYIAISAVVCFQAEAQIARSDRALLARLVPDTAIVACRGVVVLKDEANGAARSDKLWLNDVRIELADTILQSDQLRLRLTVPMASGVGVEIGDVVACAVRIESAHHRHERSTRELMWSLHERHWADARLTDPNSLVVVGGKGGLRGSIAAIRNGILDIFSIRLSPDASAVAGALLLGSRETFSGEFRDDLQTTGLAHLFALSGLNTGLLVSLCWLVLSWILVPRRARYIFLLGLLICYTLLGLGVPSLFRSAVMAGFLVLGRVLAKPSHPANLLLFAFAIELLLWPLHLLDAGFLLSYLSMAGILAAYVALSQPIQDLLTASAPGFRRRIADTLSSTIGAQLATAPMVGLLFSRVPGLAIFANLVAIPAFSLLIVLILLLLLLHPISTIATIPIARAIEGIVWIFARLTSSISDVPGASFSLNSVNWMLVPAFVAQCLAIFYCLRSQLAIGLLWIFLSLNLLIWPGHLAAEYQTGCFKLGEATESAFLIQSGDFACLAGFGAEWEAERNLALIREKLTNTGVSRLDAVIVGSEKVGHVGGAPTIVSALQPRFILDFSEFRHSLTASRFRAAIEINDVEVIQSVAGDTLVFDDVRINILWPPQSDAVSGGIVLFELVNSALILYSGVDSVQREVLNALHDVQPDILHVNLDNAEVFAEDLPDQLSRVWTSGKSGWQREVARGQLLMKLWSIPGSETI